MLVLPFKGTMQIILLAVAAALSIVALMKMATFIRNATVARTCPECGHEIEAGQQECAYCSYVDVPNNVSSSNKHYVAAAICFVVLLVGGLLLHKPLPSKCERLDAVLAEYDKPYTQCTWQCRYCGQQVVSKGYPLNISTKCPGNNFGDHSWSEL